MPTDPFSPEEFGFESDGLNTWVRYSGKPHSAASCRHYLQIDPDGMCTITAYPLRCSECGDRDEVDLYHGRIPDGRYARTLFLNLGDPECQTDLGLDTILG